MSGEDAHLQTASLSPALLVTSVSPLVTITCSYFVCRLVWFLETCVCDREDPPAPNTNRHTPPTPHPFPTHSQFLPQLDEMVRSSIKSCPSSSSLSPAPKHKPQPRTLL